MRSLQSRLGAKYFNLLTIQEAEKQLTNAQQKRNEKLNKLIKHLNE